MPTFVDDFARPLPGDMVERPITSAAGTPVPAGVRNLVWGATIREGDDWGWFSTAFAPDLLSPRDGRIREGPDVDAPVLQMFAPGKGVTNAMLNARTLVENSLIPALQAVCGYKEAVPFLTSAPPGAAAMTPGYRDHAAPYLEYVGEAAVYIDAGGLHIPLAYKTGAALPTARLLQAGQPRVVVTVEWQGTREGLPPEPPRILTLGTFILAAAAGRCGGVSRDTNNSDILEASGYLVLYTSDRPENVELPAIWYPWDSRYGTSRTVVPQYVYTPADLGFRDHLPGVPAAPPAINNPPAQQAATGNKLYL